MFPCVQSLRGIWTYFLANTLNHLLDCFPDLKIEREKQNSQHLRGMLVFLGLGAHPGVLWGVLATPTQQICHFQGGDDLGLRQTAYRAV